MKDGQPTYSAPFVIRQLGNTMESMTKTLDDFTKESTKHCSNEHKDFTVSTLAAKHGIEEMKPIFDAIVPKAAQVDNCLPSTKALIARVQAFACMENFTMCDWDAQHLGSIRWHYSGHCAYLLFDIVTLAQGVQKISESKDPPKIESIRSWADNLDRATLTIDELKSFIAASVLVHHVKIEPGQTLVIPPGWLCACTVLRQQPVIGVRKLFLAKGQPTIDAITFLHGLYPERRDVKSKLDVLTISAHPAQ